jgi:hypothetical protein
MTKACQNNCHQARIKPDTSSIHYMFLLLQISHSFQHYVRMKCANMSNGTYNKTVPVHAMKAERGVEV